MAKRQSKKSPGPQPRVLESYVCVIDWRTLIHCVVGKMDSRSPCGQWGDLVGLRWWVGAQELLELGCDLGAALVAVHAQGAG